MKKILFLIVCVMAVVELVETTARFVAGLQTIIVFVRSENESYVR